MFFQLIILIKYGEFWCNRRDREDRNIVNCKIVFYKASFLSLLFLTCTMDSSGTERTTMFKNFPPTKEGAKVCNNSPPTKKDDRTKMLKNSPPTKVKVRTKVFISLLRQRKVKGPRFVISLI